MERYMDPDDLTVDHKKKITFISCFGWRAELGELVIRLSGKPTMTTSTWGEKERISTMGRNPNP